MVNIGRVFVQFVCILTIVSSAFAQDVIVRRVTNRVITLHMTNLDSHTNITVIESQKGLVVIETEFMPFVMDMLKKVAEKYLKRDDWIYVINTHNHMHHAGGNILFSDAQVIGHETMKLDWIRNYLSTQENRVKYCDIFGIPQAISNLNQILIKRTPTSTQRRELQKRISFMREMEREIMNGFEVRDPDISFRDRLNLDLGDVHLQLIYWGDAIYHSSVLIHIIEENILVGMGLGSGPWLPDFYGNLSLDGIRSGISVLNKLYNDDFQIDYMIGIHSPDLIITREQFYARRVYFQDLLNSLIEAKNQGLSLEQIRDRISFNKRFKSFNKDFSMPENIDEIHLDNIEKVWKCLNEDESSDKSSF